MEVNIYTCVLNRSPRISEKRYAYVLECMINGEPVTKDGYGSVMGSYHMATLYAVNEALERVKKASKVRVYVEDRYISGMYQNVGTWKENGFVNARGEKVAGAEEWIRLGEQMEKHEILIVTEKHEYESWIESQIEREMKRV